MGYRYGSTKKYCKQATKTILKGVELLLLFTERDQLRWCGGLTPLQDYGLFLLEEDQEPL